MSKLDLICHILTLSATLLPASLYINYGCWEIQCCAVSLSLSSSLSSLSLPHSLSPSLSLSLVQIPKVIITIGAAFRIQSGDMQRPCEIVHLCTGRPDFKRTLISDKHRVCVHSTDKWSRLICPAGCLLLNSGKNSDEIICFHLAVA